MWALVMTSNILKKAKKPFNYGLKPMQIAAKREVVPEKARLGTFNLRPPETKTAWWVMAFLVPAISCGLYLRD